jgi:transcription termination factor Rho
MQRTLRLSRSAREERKSVTDTDLFTAGDSTEDGKLSTSVTTKTSARTDASASAVDAKPTVSGSSLSAMVLPELRALASRSGVKGASGMRKSELIAAIRASQGYANGTPPNGGDGGKSDNAAAAPVEQTDASAGGATRPERRAASRQAGSPAKHASQQDSVVETTDQSETEKPAGGRQETAADQRETGSGRRETASDQRETGSGRKDAPADQRETASDQRDTKSDERESDKGGDQQGSGGQQNRGRSDQQDDDGDGRGGRRGRRFRERRRRGERSGDGGDTELREDDVVQPVAGILDVLDNYAFVRTSGTSLARTTSMSR